MEFEEKKSWRYPLSRQIHSKLHWIYHKTWNFEGNEMATFTVEFTPGNEKNMSTWGKDRWVPRGSPCHRWNILKLSILPPHSGRCHVEKGSCFFSKIPERFQIDPFRTVGQSWCIGNAITRHFWRCPTYLKKWKFGSSVQMGQGSTYPFQWKSMETIWEFTECPWCLKNCQRVRPPINPRSCVFHGDWFPLSACLRFAWVNAGLNVNMLVIVGYFTMLKVPFWILLITSPLFACSISVALGFCGIFSTICVCVCPKIE